MRLKRIIAGCAGAALLALAPGAGAAEKDVKKIPSCQYCGMDRERFASTRMLIEYANGTAIGTCSVHCAALDLAQTVTKTITAIQVADYVTGRLVDAQKAVWVIGAGVPGVMASKSRVAFAEKGDAEAFRKVQGGAIADFDAAITSTYCDMWGDTQAMRARRAGAAH